MAYKFFQIADVLRATGLTVDEATNWQNVGHGDVQGFRGIVVHHTACGGHGDILDLDTLEKGRSDLSGPLCNIAIGRLGTIVTVAAGLAYHAGEGDGWYSIDANLANEWTIGIECENLGDGKDPWPDAEIESMWKVCAALLDYGKLPTIMCIGHDEWAPDRKIDPMLVASRTRLPNGTMSDMNAFRTAVDHFRKAPVANPPESENE